MPQELKTFKNFLTERINSSAVVSGLSKSTLELIFTGLFVYYYNTGMTPQRFGSLLDSSEIGETAHSALRALGNYLDQFVANYTDENNEFHFDFQDEEAAQALEHYVEIIDGYICHLSGQNLKTNVYVGWLLNKFFAKNVESQLNSTQKLYRLYFEDLVTYVDILLWHMNASSGLPQEYRDIQRLSYNDLFEIKKSHDQNDFNFLERFEKHNYIHYLRYDNEYVIVSVQSPIAAEKIAENGTLWCTRSKAVASQYLTDGPLIGPLIVFYHMNSDGTYEKFQLHVATLQYMNSNDKPVTMNNLDNIDWEFTYPTLNECQAVYQQAKSDPNKFIELAERRFKFIVSETEDPRVHEYLVNKNIIKE